MNLQALRNLNTDRLLDIDEAVALSAFARALESEFELLEQPVPDWVEKATDVLRTEIARRTRANKLAELRKTEAELESYKTVNERRGEAQKRLAALQEELGLTKTGRK